jgi:hypothetical protein
MGTDDLGERALHQGLIKVAAAYVHGVRGNPPGVAKKQAGARRQHELAGAAGDPWGVDTAALLPTWTRASPTRARQPPARHPEDCTE